MTQPNRRQDPSHEVKCQAIVRQGRDEMNLAELPFASLRSRGDSRKAIIYEHWATDKDGNRQQQKWMVSGSTQFGLPTEFDERVYVALMAITARQGFESRKVPLSVYQVLKIMRLPTNSRDRYKEVEQSLDRLVGVTFKSELAFWNNEDKEQITTAHAFHLVDSYWLRYKEKKREIKEHEGIAGYIVWSEIFWKSFQDNYIKSLDLGFFYGLESPTSRRLFRLLDKRLRTKSEYEFDVFDLAGKLGMTRYSFPAKVIEKLHPAFDELITRGFLKSAQVVKFNGYTRIRFAKATKAAQSGPKEEETPPERKESRPEESGPPPVVIPALPKSRPEEDEFLAADRTDAETSKRAASPEEPYSEDLARLVEDLSLQMLHDPDHVNSNVTQAHNLWRESKLSEEEFIDLVYEAKGRTLRHSGNIKKKAGYMGLKNRAPYFFRVLKDLLQQKKLEEFRRGFGEPKPPRSE